MKNIATRLPQAVNGDVVRLRSGGPLMTVEHHRDDGYVCVRWFERKRFWWGFWRKGDVWEHRWECFHPDCLFYAEHS